MKIRSLILLAAFALVTALSLSQFNVVSAQASSEGLKVTRPITYFTYQLRGRISLRLFNKLLPAPNVSVVARNLNTGEIFTAKSGIMGDYSLSVKQAGQSAMYVIAPKDPRNITWKPAKIEMKISRNTSNLDFLGLIK